MSTLPLPEVLDTERLVLRPWVPEDAPALHEALGESVAHLLPWIPWATAHAPSEDEAAALVRRWMDERESGRNFIWAVFRRDDGWLLGGIGLYARVGDGALEMGYWVRATASGVGYTSEAAGALVRAGFGVPGVERLHIHLNPENVASRRIPEKLGFTLVETRPAPPGYRFGPTAVYVLARGGREAGPAAP